MNAFEAIIQDLDNSTREFFKETSACEIKWNEFNNFATNFENALKVYKGTGREFEVDFANMKISTGNDAVDIAASRRSSLKENVNPMEETLPRTRSRRTAKQRQQEENNINLKIKQEKRSTELTVKVKTEAEEMPAPSRRPPRKKRNNKQTSTKITIKEEKEEDEDKKNDSDVIIEEPVLPMIDLVEEDNKSRRTNKRTTTKSKRNRTSSNDADDTNHENKEKRAKSNEEIIDETQYDDARSSVTDKESVNNATYMCQPSVDPPTNKDNLNTTVIVQKPKILMQNLVPQTEEDLMTDDESIEIKKNTATRTVSKTTKQVFNPYERSPIKKKIQAFEKLQEQSDANLMSPRITRTKSKVKKNEQSEVDASHIPIPNNPSSAVKEKAKLFTPFTKKFMPSSCSTDIKTSTKSSINDNTLMSTTSMSASKITEAVKKEREKRLKEAEATKKRNAQIEEKKKKLDEKQLKAQQQREALLKQERLKALEMQKLKEERHKQILAEKEIQKQKMKEELEKKRWLAKKKAIEEKRRIEEKQREEQKKVDAMAANLAKQDDKIEEMLQKQLEREKSAKLPSYLKSKAPMLPTVDCYDSDDEEYKDCAKPGPVWMKNINEMQFVMMAAGEQIKNSYFSRVPQTPDLIEIFEVISTKKLKRSSSAYWNKPPRFTMLPGLEEHDENDESFYE